MNIKIRNKDDLIKAIGYMHDSGFNNDNIKYDKKNKTFSIITKEYEFKGRFIQRKTDVVKSECKLILRGVKCCDMVFTGKVDENGYKTLGEDYINTTKIKDNSLIIITTFQRIKLEVDNFDGEFERNSVVSA